jgi:hypothetical protein
MKKNMGIVDKAIRILVAVVIAVLYFTQVVSGTFSMILLLVAVIFLVTSLVGTCPLYMLFGISTIGKKK